MTQDPQSTAADIPQDFAGKGAIVTGASRGIGLAIAQELASRGAKVVLTARGKETLEQAVATLPAGSAIGIAGKAHDPAHRKEVLDTVAREFGGLDILVNNAGINPVYGPIEDIELDAARKILEVNVIGTFAWVQEALKHEGLKFRERRGNVINLSSIAGERPPKGIGFYGVSKAAVTHLTHILAAELGPEIRVNAIAPAVVKTNFAKALYEGREEEVAADYPLKRLGVPEDIASAAGFLASEKASWITGQLLIVDGGVTQSGGVA